MEVSIAERLRPLASEDLVKNLRRCVHCGFCNATCPTYQLTGDELEGPRGRIYQIKEAYQSGFVSQPLIKHLDQCLTCRACETTCPSGVEYARVLEAGRALITHDQARSVWQRLLQRLLVIGLSQSALLKILVPVGRWLGIIPRFSPISKLKPVPGLKQSQRDVLPASPVLAVSPPQTMIQQTVVFLNPCVQDALDASIDEAAIRVLAKLNTQVLKLNHSGCCGALAQHLSFEERAQAQARRNIDAWWPHLEHISAIVITSSGCTVQVKDYAHLLKHDLKYAAKAQSISAKTQDLSEWLEAHWPTELTLTQTPTVAVQLPCSLQHAQKRPHQLSAFLQRIGVSVRAVKEAHLCCGSAGTYSVLNSSNASLLKKRKLAALKDSQADVILTANIGCYQHLKQGSDIPLWHYIQWLDAQLA